MSENNVNNKTQHAQHTLHSKKETKQHSFTTQPLMKKQQQCRGHTASVVPRRHVARIDDADEQVGHNDICGTQTFL